VNIIEANIGLSLIRGNDEDDAALASNEGGVGATGGNVSSDNGDGSGLAASSANNADELLHRG
jgi:hypothetical protein